MYFFYFMKVIAFSLLIICAFSLNLKGMKSLETDFVKVNKFQGFTPDDTYKLVLGVLIGMKFPDTDSAMKCIHDIPDLYYEIEEAIDLIETLDFKNIQKLIQGIALLLQDVMTILNGIKPCYSDSEYLDFIISKLQNINVYDLVLKMLIQSSKLYQTIKLAIQDWNKKDYKAFGEDLGTFFYLAILS